MELTAAALTDTSNEVMITVEAQQDDTSPIGDFDTGEPDEDRKYEAEIISRVNGGDVWAWACVRVVAEAQGERGESHFLGGCTYENERDFRANSGYFEDLRDCALYELNKRLNCRVKLASGETFSYEESCELARLIFKRWSRDMSAAANAWRRLHQNNCTDQQFAALVTGE